MKRNIFARRGQKPPVIAAIALLITLGVVITTPLAFAKYYTQKTFSNSGSVALWNITKTAVDPANSVIVYVNGAHSVYGSTNTTETKTFTITSTSRVRAKLTMKMRYVKTDSAPALTSGVATEGSQGFLSLGVTGGPSGGFPTYYYNPTNASIVGTYTFTSYCLGGMDTDQATCLDNRIRVFKTWYDAEQVD